MKNGDIDGLEHAPCSKKNWRPRFAHTLSTRFLTSAMDGDSDIVSVGGERWREKALCVCGDEY